MPYWKTHARETQEIAVLLFPRFSNHCLANAVEPLRAANDFLGWNAYRWSFVTIDGCEVQSSSGLPVAPNSSLREHRGGSTLIVASSYDVRLFATDSTARSLRAAAQRFATIAGLDTGAWLMAHAGLLDGFKATIHRDELTAFSERFANVDTVSERYVIDGTRVTCGGAMAAFDLTLDLIGQTHGSALRLEVAALFLHQTVERPDEPSFPKGSSRLVEQAIALMSNSLEARLTVGGIARQLGTSQRTLGRAFQSDLGASPQMVYRQLRLSAARRYAEHSDYSVMEIALRCGYRNAAAMTRAFVAQYGVPPSVLRSGAR